MEGDATGEPPLPSVYEILGLVGMKKVRISREDEEKIDKVLAYCFDERYQFGIQPGYGILRTPEGKFYSMGWSIHLPGFNQKLDESIDMKQLLFWLDVLSCFNISKELKLFQDFMNYIEKFKCENGFYCFPKEYIPNKKSGYCVNAISMGLGENRKQKEACLLESTFRILKIKKNLAML